MDKWQYSTREDSDGVHREKAAAQMSLAFVWSMYFTKEECTGKRQDEPSTTLLLLCEQASEEFEDRDAVSQGLEKQRA